MDFQDNDRLSLANDFVLKTNTNIFLTGKAGTGKTSFLHYIKRKNPKRMIVLAPTGVAAINAGGVTIHSFFQLSFTPFIPGFNYKKDNQTTDYNIKFNKNKIKIIKSLDLLIIDEISMVRADLLDAISDILCKYRNNNKSFGGVQLLMIGDLNQLSPIVKDEDWNLLKDYYATPYFFSSHALTKSEYITIELQHIYRQQDINFIKLLNEIRDNKITNDSISTLNDRYNPNFKELSNDNYIILTTHNNSATSINDQKLNDIDTKSYTYTASITGDFSEYMYPTDKELILKEGAQVMFIKNDSSQQKLYYNGKIGIITNIDEDNITIKCEKDYATIDVNVETWNNTRYVLNEESKEIEEEIIGSFTQFPLKLAWAITIHKSQGLTFNKVILDINSAFAYGQVYVALSRCTSIEGLVLMTKFSPNTIKSNTVLENFSNIILETPVDENNLLLAKINYQQQLMLELFDFKDLKNAFLYFLKLFYNNSSNFFTNHSSIIADINQQSNTHIFSVFEKFNLQLLKYISQNKLQEPETNKVVQDRICKASQYFYDKLQEIFVNNFNNIYFKTDNKEVNKDINIAIEKFELILTHKLNNLLASTKGFNTNTYLKIIVDTELDFVSKFNKDKSKKQTKENQNSLYNDIIAWRDNIAYTNNTEPYIILPHKTIMEIVKKKPISLKELNKIKGIGKIKSSNYGEDIIEIVSKYKSDISIDSSNELPITTKKTIAGGSITKYISLELFKQGKTIKEIAEHRMLTPSTITKHLEYFALNGEIPIETIVELDKLDEIKEFITNNYQSNITLSELMQKCNNIYSYNELRFTINLLKKEDTLK